MNSTPVSELSQLIQFTVDFNDLQPELNFSPAEITCILSHERPVLLLITDGTENNAECVTLVGHVLKNKKVIKINVFPMIQSINFVNIFALPIFNITSSLLIQDNCYFKENMDPLRFHQFTYLEKGLGTTPIILYSVKNGDLIVNATVTKITWEKNEFQPLLKNSNDQRLETMYCIFTFNTTYCKYWNVFFASATPICNVEMISEHNVSVYKIEYRSPVLFVFLRYLKVMNSRFCVDECSLRLRFSKPNMQSVALNICMPYFNISEEFKTMEIYFPERMTLTPNHITQINLRGTFENPAAVGLFIPKKSNVLSFPFIWQPRETFRIYVYCRNETFVTEHDIIGHVYFISREQFPHSFHPTAHADCKSKVEAAFNSFRINFLGNDFFSDSLPILTVHPMTDFPYEQIQETENIRHNSMNITPRFKRMQL